MRSNAMVGASATSDDEASAETRHGEASEAQPHQRASAPRSSRGPTPRCCSASPARASAARRCARPARPSRRSASSASSRTCDTGPLQWGAYGLTEPGAGSDVAGIRTSCRKDGKHWVLNGRKCYITNGARASWTVIFATIDPSLGRAGHRAFVVEKGTPGFAVGKHRGEDGPARERDGRARARGLPRPRGEPARRRGEATCRRRAS